MTTLKLQRTNTRELTKEEILTLIKKNKGVYTEYYDETYIIALVEHLFPFLNQMYFRPTFIGFENYPKRNNPNKPLIFASNHSGMAFPWDALVFGGGLYEVTKSMGIKSIRPLTAPMLSETVLMNPFMIPDFWKRVGGIDATSLNFETMMHFHEADVLIYPEGIPGIGKGFNRRYQLQRFSTSFIRMSLKHKTDIIPVYSINGEYINPYSYRSKIVNSITQKVGIPYIPVGLLTLLIPIFPWLFYFGLPAHFHFVMGKRLKPHEWIDKDFDDLEMEDLKTIRDKVQKEMQQQLNDAVQKYGQKPYSFLSLLKTQFSNLNSFWNYNPWSWNILFADFERQYKRFKKDGTPIKIKRGFGAIFYWVYKNPFNIFYWIPLIGLIPLAIRGYIGMKK